MIADLVAQRLQMPQNWINEGVRRMAPPIGNPVPTLLPFGDYPRDPASAVGLRVFLPTPEYMLAMKILANRFDFDLEKIQSDERDAVAPMMVTGLSTRDQLLELIRLCYPHLPALLEPVLHPRIATKIEILIDAFATGQTAPVHPAWHAGRGSPIDEGPE